MWGCIWVVVIGEIWKQMNKVTLKNDRINHVEIYVMTQLKVWLWITCKKHLANFTYSEWCIDHSLSAWGMASLPGDYNLSLGTLECWFHNLCILVWSFNSSYTFLMLMCKTQRLILRILEYFFGLLGSDSLCVLWKCC